MTFRTFLILALFLTACSHRISPSYRLVTELSEDLKELQKTAARSKTAWEVDLETGDFKGRYKSHTFTGKYAIEHVSAGFVKGFFYRVKLQELNRPSSRNAGEEAFFERLSAARRLYVAPDKLRQPDYTFMEVTGPGSDKMVFVKLTIDN